LDIELEKIIKGCIGGSNEARTKLYEKYAGKMWVVCLRYSIDKNKAKDILQEGFIKIFDKIHQYKGRGSFEGWMRRIFINIAIAEFRKERMLSFDIYQNKKSLYEEEDIDDNLPEIKVKELLDIINELPPQYKLVFNMYAIEGFSHKEIAIALNISEGTSKSNLSRARTILKRKVYERIRQIDNIYK